MTNPYFSKFQTIEYANYMCRNITQRVALIHSLRKNADNYAPINVGSTRADIVANKVYGDSYLDWEIWLDNNILDPYYGWSLDQNDFNAYMIDKYGSVEWATQAISHYRLNWPTEDVQVSVAYYEYTLPPTLRCYYQPVWGNGGNIIAYQRALQEWVMNTNQIAQINLEMTQANTTFQANDVLYFIDSGNVVGQCTTVVANSTQATVQHIIANNGPISAPIGLMSFQTGLTATSNAYTVIQTNIDDADAAYWEPVSYFELEQEANAKKQFVNMTDPGLVMQISAGITTLLANN